MKNKEIVVRFEDEDKLVAAIKKVRQESIIIKDVFTPFPVHGIDEAMGEKPSRIPTAGFIFGCIGALVGFGMQAWIFTMDWPIDFGGKPYFSLPSFIPVIFELTVLFAAVGMIGVFLYSSRLFPGAENKIYDLRSTDNQFIMVLDSGHIDNSENLDTFIRKLKSFGMSDLVSL